MNDNQYITKTDLKTFGIELVVEIKKELEDRLENKFQLMREEIRKENKMYYADIKKDNATYYGLIQEDFEHKFDLMKEYLVDVPNLVRELRNKAEENDEEHRDFRARLRLLEQG